MIKRKQRGNPTRSSHMRRSALYYTGKELISKRSICRLRKLCYAKCALILNSCKLSWMRKVTKIALLFHSSFMAPCPQVFMLDIHIFIKNALDPHFKMLLELRHCQGERKVTRRCQLDLSPLNVNTRLSLKCTKHTAYKGPKVKIKLLTPLQVAKMMHLAVETL